MGSSQFINRAVLLGEQIAGAHDPAIRPGGLGFHGADVIAIENSKVVISQTAQILLTEHVCLTLLDSINASFVVHLRDEAVVQQYSGIIGIVVHHHRNVDGIVDGFIVVVQLLLVGAHVPRSNRHDAVRSIGLCSFRHFYDIAGAVSASRSNNLDAIVMACLDISLVDSNLFLFGHCNHFAGGARWDDTGDAVLS